MTSPPIATPAVAAVITVNDMYHELQGLRTDVQTLAGQINDVPRQLKDLALDGKDHENRLRIVERRQNFDRGVAAVVSALLSSGVLVALLAHHGN